MTTIHSQAALFNVRNAFLHASKVQQNTQGQLVSTIRSTKDIYTPSAPVASRSTYLQPSRGLQSTTNQISNSHLQANTGWQSTSHFFATQLHVPNSFAVPVASDNGQTLLKMESTVPRNAVWADPWAIPTHNFHEIVDYSQGFTDEIAELFVDYDEAGAMIFRDRDGNILTSDKRREVTVWDHLRAGRQQELLEELEANPGLFWRFDMEGANKDFEGHDILNAIFPKVYESVTSLVNVTDEYGYTFRVPAFASNENFTSWSLTTHENGRLLDTIDSVDRSGLGDGVGLYGLTLEERDIFYAEVQKIFDRNGVQADARKENYRLLEAAPQDMPKPTVDCSGQPLPEDFVWAPFPGGWQWGGGIDWIEAPVDRTTLLNVQEEILGNSVLRSLFEKADNVRTGVIADDTLAQQYSIRVTDDECNRLANDRIIVEARNGNQIEMSVEQFSQMSRLEITKLLR
jgi:hypothetical protein